MFTPGMEYVLFAEAFAQTPAPRPRPATGAARLYRLFERLRHSRRQRTQ